MVEIARREGRPAAEARRKVHEHAVAVVLGWLFITLTRCARVLIVASATARAPLPDGESRFSGGSIWACKPGPNTAAPPHRNREPGAAAKSALAARRAPVPHRLSQVRRHSRQKRWPQPASTGASE